MLITGLYAALLAILVAFLSLRVVFRRNTAQVGLGSGGDAELARRRRAHANLVEYAPLALLLLLLLELGHVAPLLLHVLGITLVLARLMHAWGLSHSSGTSWGRFLGTALTLAVMLVAAGMLLWQQLVIWMV